jgi:hypothetical protein
LTLPYGRVLYDYLAHLEEAQIAARNNTVLMQGRKTSVPL